LNYPYQKLNIQGGLLHVSLANFDCPQWSRFFFAVRNLNKFTETVRAIFHLHESFVIC